jgi:hypothetical protein
VLPKGDKVTRRSIEEYAEAIRGRYLGANKKAKGAMLDEFTRVTGLHRKAAIRLLGRRSQHKGARRRGRPSEYADIVPPLKAIWEASDRLCSKRLQPFIPEMIKVLRQHDEQHINAATEARLCGISASTIDRLLKPYRRSGGRKTLSTTRPGKLLKNTIPIKTFADWGENRSGFVEVDLVAHCGDSVEGFYLNTLCAVDVASGWTECLPVFGKWQVRVLQAIHHMRLRLPFPLLGVDSDNGGEFINRYLSRYCYREGIEFTKSRAYKKNDSCYVEQKNGNIVRRLVGYDRYSTKAAFDCLDRLYCCVRQYTNFFQPTMKLLAKTRHGARVYKLYDKAETPYQRLLSSGVLPDTKRTELSTTYRAANPVLLLRYINENLEQLWRLADRTNSVTRIMKQPGAPR